MPIVTAYLVYVVLGAVLAYVVVARALRIDERAAMIDLDRELQEPTPIRRTSRVNRS